MTAGTHSTRGSSRRTLATVSTMLATMMQTVDTTIANVALPQIQGSMSATTEQAAWVLTSYIIASAIMTAPAGFIANRFGRRRLFLLSVAGFTLASALCGIATSIEELVLFRLLQGACGAALVPMSQAALLDAYPPHKYARAMAIWGVGIMVGPILGPTLGGYLTETLGWRWVFFVNLPVGILTLIGLRLFLDETDRQGATRFDWTGFIYLSIALVSLQLMLDRGQTRDWFDSAEIVAEAVLAGLFLYLAVVHMLTTPRPFINTALFRDLNYSAGLVVMFLLGALMLATMALLPPFLEGLLGYPVDLVGEVLAPRGIGTMISMFLTGYLAERMDLRALVSLGFALSGLALWQMSHFTPQISPWEVVTSGLLQGLGLGLVMVPLATMAYSTLPAHLRNEAAALFGLIRNLGGSFGLSIVVAQLAVNSQMRRAELVEHINFSDLQNLPGIAGTARAVSPEYGVAMLNGLIEKQATFLAFLDNFHLIMLASLAMIPVTLLLRPPPTGANRAV